MEQGYAVNVLKGAALWRIISADELEPARPDPNPRLDPNPVTSSSQASRSSIAVQQPPQQPL